jgi:hypothetical protein
MCRRLFDINTVGTDGLPIPPIDLYLWLTEWSDFSNDSVKSNRGVGLAKDSDCLPGSDLDTSCYTYPWLSGGRRLTRAVEVL